jgi:hypothetical protein
MNCHYQDKRVTNMDQINVIGVELLYGLDQWENHSLPIRMCWNCRSLDFRIDSHSQTCLFQNPWPASVHFSCITFTIDKNWIIYMFRIITSINFDFRQCWNSWFLLFCIMSTTLINHIWIKFTMDTDWIIFVFRFIIALNCDSSKCSIHWWLSIRGSVLVFNLTWRWEWNIHSREWISD